MNDGEPRFRSFVAIDWSGAKGRRHKGIAVAEARHGSGAPRIIRPDHVWSRTELLDWLFEQAKREPTLFGFDFSFAPPFVERGAYLPGEANVPTNARAFWAYVDHRSDDEDLGAASFLEAVHRPHFYFGIADVDRALMGLGSDPASLLVDPTDHQSDALVTAAGMRALAQDPSSFAPPGLTAQIARTEGWTFGVL
ncbi:hypothetical protein [Sphingomonas sp.]|uniref:hypothetical protein n=1 Tax=Sphingomonas sp. TaxID=28214 RepID=UPI0037534F6B